MGHVHHRFGIAPAQQRLRARPFPRLLQKGIRHLGQFGQPAAGEGAGRVLVLALLDRVVDARRVDAGGARLHLHLRPVDPGFIIGELARQVLAGHAPIQPQVI